MVFTCFDPSVQYKEQAFHNIFISENKVHKPVTLLLTETRLMQEIWTIISSLPT